MTEILKANNNIIDVASTYLKQGKILCLPTETVYALSCSAYNEYAVKKIYEIKKREQNKSFAVFCHDINQISEIVYLTPKAIEIINQFTPGPITIILKDRGNLPSIVNSGKSTLAIRIPDNEFTLNLLKTVNIPLIGTSVNITGHKSAISIKDIDREIYKSIDLIIDGEEPKFKIPSTIIEIIDEKIHILREGVISLEALLK